jgi:hypothetical protein
VPLKSKITHAEFYCNGKLMDSYLDSLSGMTFAHSMESLGEEKSMLCLEDFRAKTLVPQEKVLVLRENNQECGEKWQGSFAKYDQSSCLWKTHQCSLIEDWEQFLGIWPTSGSMLNGECWERQILEQNTTEKEYGLLPDNEKFFHTPTTGSSGGSNSRKALKKRKEAIWPTPTTPSGGGNAGGSGAHKNALKNGTYIPSSINPSLYEWLMGWPQEWTDLKPLETDKYHKWQQLHGNY